MAELAPPSLVFDGTCPDCGERQQVLPLPIPGVEDDFDWKVRDYDSYRLFMMQELASRFPDRRRWTSADMEVVIVELLSAALDRASHAMDRVQAERYLDTARRPESVRRLLQMIGWQADAGVMERARAEYVGADIPTDAEALERYWQRHPSAMEAARYEGPHQIAEQHRMVTLQDHADMMQRHPLCALAQARMVWSGAWHTILVSALLEDALPLDTPIHDGEDDADAPTLMRRELWDQVVAFHNARNLPIPPVTAALSGRTILRTMIEQYRMIGSEVFLEGARAAPITVSISIRAKSGYFRSELRQAVAAVFTSDQGGFFEPGRLGFGAPLYASDVIDATMQIEGVAVACLNLFRRTGRGQEDQSSEGIIIVEDDEYIQCLNDPRAPEHGTLRITVQGGETG
ncbi:hypothetical protein [uncultured Litoreibacter sp.]|uniref:hypothetical protein n=1 Tax=uncultured Litoreibacter sp. TaxID=1392394 RepID=UPI0026152544|nr:hypothetical protein [uncultured Litoreibacter sp.]